MEKGYRRAPFRNRGVTLAEAVLYTSVALAVILGGLFFARQVSLAATVTEQIRILSALVSEGRSDGRVAKAVEILWRRAPSI
jgi:hypothetical protein